MLRVESKEELHRCQDVVHPRLLSPFLRVHGDGARLVQALRDHHVAEGAVEPSHLNDIEALVCPVDVSCERSTQQTSGYEALKVPTVAFLFTSL